MKPTVKLKFTIYTDLKRKFYVQRGRMKLQERCSNPKINFPHKNASQCEPSKMK